MGTSKSVPVTGVDLDYRAVFDAVPDLYLLLDHNLNIVTASKAYCSATMTDAAAIAGRPLFEVFPDNPGDPNADGVRNLKLSLERVLKLKRPDSMAVQKYDIPGPDGRFEERYWSPLNTPLLGEGGKVAFIIHRVADVTGLVRLESESAEREQLARDQRRIIEELRRTSDENAALLTNTLYLASIVESSHDPIIATSLSGTITGWNRAAERLFGYRSDEIKGHPVTVLLPRDRRDEEKALVDRIIRGEDVARYQTQRRAKDGTVLDVALTLSPIRDAGGAIIGVSKIVEDITQRLLAEHRVRRLEADRGYLADIVESSNDAIIARTMDGRVASWNKAAAAMFGYSAREIVGMPVDQLAPEDRKGEPAEMFRRIVENHESLHYETTRLRKDGTPILVSVTASPVFGEGGEVKGTSAIMRDITEQRRAEEKLKNLQAELVHLSRWNTMGMMASTIAHELNQPLTAAVNYIRAARRILDIDKTGRTGEFLDKAVEEAKLAGGIIRSLREFIDKRETSRAPENINKVVEEALSLSLAGGAEDHAKVNVAMEPLLPPVLIDKIQIEQVLLNLIRNALDAMENLPEKNLSITTAMPEPGFVQVTVADNGPGMEAEMAEQLFQPFVTSKEKGMGIGLTICQSIIENHGGRIWAEPRKGGLFHFRLPSADAAPDEEVDMTTATIIVIDDHDSVRHSLRALLESAGYDVRDYPTATAYLDDANAGGDCLVVDLRMPQMSGIELQQELTRRGIVTPLILVTGHGDIQRAVQAMKAGAFDFLEKPFDDEALLASILRGLAEGRRAKNLTAENSAAAEMLGILTEREKEVLDHLVQGKSNKLIAHELGISPRTVEIHRARLQDKLKARDLSDLVRLARAAGQLH